MAIAICCTAQFASAAPDSKLIEYTVKKGDTCVAIARSRWGDKKWISIIHDNNDLGPPPHDLKPGTVLHLPMSLPSGAVAQPSPAAPTKAHQPGDPDARLTFLRNQVEAYTPERHNGKRDEALSRGHRVNTLASSSAEVTFVDTSRLQLGEHTLVVILGGTSTQTKSTGGAEDTTLVKGTLRAHLAELAGGKPKPLSLSTPAAKVKMDPGEARVAVDEKNTTRLAVYRGRSKMKAAGKEVTVQQGFGSKAEEGKAPTKPRPLPAPPRWAKLPPRTIVLMRGTVDVSATYAQGDMPADAPKPKQWHVQLARDDEFNDLVVDTFVPDTVTQLDEKGLGAGSYFARVSAIDEDDFQGKASPVASVQVVGVNVATGARGRVEVSAGAFCAVDDGDFEEMEGEIVVDPTRSHTLRCASDADGNDESETITIPASNTARHVRKTPATVEVGPISPVRDDDGEWVANFEVKLADSDKRPVERASVTVRTGEGAHIVSAVVPLKEPGTYGFTVRWFHGERPIPMFIVVDGRSQYQSAISPSLTPDTGPKARKYVE